MTSHRPLHTSVLEIDLPEVSDRSPFTRPTSHLVKDGPENWAEVPNRRPSKTLMVNRIRLAVDEWRANGYRGASQTSQRLLDFWFEESHVSEREPFRYFFCQREAIETIIYLYEVRGLRDCFELINRYFEEPDGTQLELSVTTRGQRKLRRFVPEVGRETEQDLPREKLTRLAVKMATGAGKTVVMALTIVWSYLHRRFEETSDLADNFLLIAPNIIVFERLRQDFEGGRIFYSLPLVPPEWRNEWQVDVILRGDSKLPKEKGTIFLTNIQQIYERDLDDEPRNPVEVLLGSKPPPSVRLSLPMLDRVRSLSNVMVLNDEAHHLHDDTLRWNETLLELDDHLSRRGRGLVAWFDFTATPRNQHGTFYPWIIVDYPLAQAVEDRIVKTPLIIHQTDKKDPVRYAHAEAGDTYNEWIAIALARWREHVKDYGERNERPILFVMAETTRDADSIAERLEREGDLNGRVLTIHVNERGNEKGEISRADLEVARQAAREIDSGRSRYRAVVSVLMLREGWDVRNVSVILGLRPFSAKANILPEQAIGRGLRLMRGIPMGQTQVLELIGTHAFEEFVRELEKEGLGVTTTRTPPKPGKHVYPRDDRRHLDIEIPRTSALFEREFKNLDLIEPRDLASLGSESDLSDEQRKRIDLVHGTVDVRVHSDEVEFTDDNVPAIEGLLASLTNRVMKRARVTGVFPQLFPKVRNYVRERCFDTVVDLSHVAVRRALNDSALLDTIASLFSRRIGELTAERRDIRVENDPLRLSETPEFSWRRHYCEAEKTIFNIVACHSKFEADFAQFLAEAKDVERFAKLCEQFTGFFIQYVKSNGALGAYYPDFVVVQDGSGGRCYWIVETKGQEDVEVAAKDEQMRRWCGVVSRASHQRWGYLKVPYREYHARRPSSFGDLLRALTAQDQMLLPRYSVRDPYIDHVFRLIDTGLETESEPTIPILVRVTDTGWSPPTGCVLRSRVGDVCSCDATDAAIQLLLSDPRVKALSASRPGMPPDCGKSMPFIGVPQVHGAPRNECGDRALVAVIDDGIDVLHRAFRTPLGKSRILAVWDQGDNTGPPPTLNGVAKYGTLHSHSDIEGYLTTGVVGKGLGRNADGHGTHVTSIAAGAEVKDADGNVLFPGGVAPGASIIVVVANFHVPIGSPRSIGYSTSHVDALAFIDEFAQSKSLPVVVNVSQGMNAGAHDGSSLLEAAFDQFSGIGRKPGRVIIKSAGNQRKDALHAYLQVGGLEEICWKTKPLSSTHVVELWFDSRDDMTFALRPPTGTATSGVGRARERVQQITTHGDLINISFIRFHQDNGASQVIVSVQPSATPAVEHGTWTLEITPGNLPAGGVIHAWIEPSRKAISFTSHVAEDYTLTIPGTSHQVISVAAINVPSPPVQNFRVADFSCFGPTRDGRSQPELCAPGNEIRAARGGTLDGTIVKSGTSMSAPHVCGAVATLLSAWAKKHPPPSPMLNLAQVRAALIASAQGPSPIWNHGTGHGRLDVDRLLEHFGL